MTDAVLVTTIAHFRPRARWFGIPLVVVLLVLAGIFGSSHWVFARLREPEHQYLFVPYILLCMLYPIGLLTALQMARLVLFQKSKAVWIEEGRLIYIHRLYFSVMCDQITRLSDGTYGRTYKSEAIVIARREGKGRIMPTGSLLETRQVIKDRIHAALSMRTGA